MENNWAKTQPRNKKGKFKSKWNDETISWIIRKLRSGVKKDDIAYSLTKKYGSSVRTSIWWIKIAERVASYMKDGLTLQEAIETDKRYRSMKRKGIL